MTVKRTRTSTETEMALAAAAAKSSLNQTATAAQWQSRTAIGSSSVQESSVQSQSFNRSRLGGFLERCQYCKKRIPEGVEVFMYKDFSAFCSNGCRDIQISLDKLAEKVITSSRDMKIHSGY